MRRILAPVATLFALAGCVQEGDRPADTAPGPTLGDTLLALFDSLESIHQAVPDLALLGRMHPGGDTVMFVEGPEVLRFTGDSLVRRVAAAHAGVRSMGPEISERTLLVLDDRHAILTGRERVRWTDQNGEHEWDGLLTIVVARSGDRWVIRGYRM